ncbi:putative diacylglycerol O-acyltransferase tgs1 [Tilletia horrida]|uniref:Trimethylguanosine synthase n=1 Tax=Tilletia horrida TaxID=155126 RepID=A0AAN6JQ46_9BASI|nr:putative diacylglycerol O-acyltransferase tgs1 [Tilletia horrida]
MNAVQRSTSPSSDSDPDSVSEEEALPTSRRAAAQQESESDDDSDTTSQSSSASDSATGSDSDSDSDTESDSSSSSGSDSDPDSDLTTDDERAEQPVQLLPQGQARGARRAEGTVVNQRPAKKARIEAHDTNNAFHPLALHKRNDLPEHLRKYWYGRYDLFSLYDSGISLDEASWYSVTPESVAARIAERCRCHTILDAFGGAGGNAIQFAKVCERVVAVEIDPVKVELARHNAKIYGVEDRITFLTGDIRDFARAHRRAHGGSALLNGDAKGAGLKQEDWQGAEKFDFDVVFLSPPWGGPAYITSAPLAGTSAASVFNTANTSMEHSNSRARRKRKRAQERNVAAEEAGEDMDTALAAQLGLPLSFTSRHTRRPFEEEAWDDDNDYYEDDEAPTLLGDITATPVAAPAAANLHTQDESGTAYSLSRLEPIPGKELFTLAKSLCASPDDAAIPGAPLPTGGGNIALYLPRNSDLGEIAALVARDAQRDDAEGAPLIHLDECWLRGKLKAICAYFGDLASAWDPEQDGWRS